jgi:hypothetical protein
MQRKLLLQQQERLGDKGYLPLPHLSGALEQTMNDKKIELTLGLVNAVMQYLGTRPYAEVADMVQAIREQAIPQVPMPEAKAEVAAE